jgi:hypothetical protein
MERLDEEPPWEPQERALGWGHLSYCINVESG